MTDQITALTQAQALAAQIQTITQAGIDYVPPAPPTPPLDLLSWWVPKPGKFVRATFVRALADSRQAIYNMKTASGWPWDINTVDELGVYFRVTENDAKDAAGNGIGWPPNGSAAAYRLYTLVNLDTPSLGVR